MAPAPAQLRSASRRRLLWTAMLAVLCLVTQLSDAFHLMVVRHVRCAEHGQLVHADDHGHPAAAGTRGFGSEFQARGGETARDRRVAVQQNGDEAEHGHEHCLALNDRRNRDTSTAIIVAERPVSEPVQQLQRVPTRTSSGRALFELAPKTSPPAC